MILKKETTRESIWKTIRTKQGDFEVLVRRPTYDEVLYDLAIGAELALRNRVETLIIDWRGVTDENGAEVKFSVDALVSVVESCPEAGLELILAIGERFAGDTPKNLPSPPATSSADGQTATPATTTSSTSSSDSEIILPSSPI